MRVKRCWPRTCPAVNQFSTGQNRYSVDADWRVLDGVHLGATWRIQLNCPYAAAMRPYVSCSDLLLIIVNGSWFRKKHPRVMSEYVHLPPLPESGDVLRSMTVIPYLEDMCHGDDDEDYDPRDPDEIDEHVLAITEGISSELKK